MLRFQTNKHDDDDDDDDVLIFCPALFFSLGAQAQAVPTLYRAGRPCDLQDLNAGGF